MAGGPTIFTRIIRGEVPAHRLYEDERTFAFLDIRPIREGHTLVVPKAEVDVLWDLDRADYDAVFSTAYRLAPAISRAAAAQRCGVIAAGFEVPHAHVHVIPADTMEDLDFRRGRPAADADLAAVAQRIRAAL
jgi:histidine triad (HIT) family protein